MRVVQEERTEQEAHISKVWDGTSDEVVAALVGEYAPEDEILEVLAGGKILKFKALADRARFNSLKKRGQEFAQKKVGLTEESAKWYDTDDETKGWAFVLAKLSVEPKLEPEGLLKLAKEAFLGFEVLKDGYLAGLARTRIAAEELRREAAKKGSSETSSGDID